MAVNKLRLKPTHPPIITEKVAIREWPLEWVSGMISSQITNNIAPAANANAIGKTGWNTVTEATPNAPPIGSTNPVNVAMPMARQRLYPRPIKGNATAKPSGIF